jgi:hypothetical protein
MWSRRATADHTLCSFINSDISEELFPSFPAEISQCLSPMSRDPADVSNAGVDVARVVIEHETMSHLHVQEVARSGVQDALTKTAAKEQQGRVQLQQ